MESGENIDRVKREPNDNWRDAGDDYNLNSVDSCEVKNVEKFPFYKLPANHVNEVMGLQEILDEKIFIELECKNVKPEPTSLSKTICKTEDQSYPPIVKLENRNQTKYCNEKSLVILIKKDFNYHDNCQFQVNLPLNLDHRKKVEKFRKMTQTKSFYEKNVSLKRHGYTRRKSIGNQNEFENNTVIVHWKKTFKCDICRKSFGQKGNLNAHINAVHNRSKPFECEICHKSFGYQCSLKTHTIIVHDKSKPFKCDICRKSFGQKGNLNAHINAVHNRSKSFEFEICHKSFGYASHLKSHISIVHDFNKPYECEICHKSFGQKAHLKAHVMTVHDQNKPFECEICHKSFGYKSNLRSHIKGVHSRSKPFECKTCHKSFSQTSDLNKHITAVHDRSKPVECDICHKSFLYQNVLKRHINRVHCI